MFNLLLSNFFVGIIFDATSDLFVRFRLDCLHKRVSRSKPRLFVNNYLQEVGTYIQDAHSSPSIKGKSRSSSKKRTVHKALDFENAIEL